MNTSTADITKVRELHDERCGAYERRARESFPCPAGYREIEFLEDLPVGIQLWDRILLQNTRSQNARCFTGWSDNDEASQIQFEQYGASKPGPTKYGAPHCWYVVDEHEVRHFKLSQESDRLEAELRAEGFDVDSLLEDFRS